jgi:hypothetical protein
VKDEKKLNLGDMVDSGPDKELEFFAVYTFQYTKTTNVERLGKIRGMSREIEGDNSVVFVELLELGREMAFIAV